MTVRQCETCQHWQPRGGMIVAPVLGCQALEDDKASPRMVAIVTRMARLLAARNQCPVYAPFPNYPDAYRAEDLPLS